MSGEPAFRLVQPGDPAQALGLAVAQLMTSPAFAKLPFGEWSKVLAGQINRGHCRFAVDGEGRVVGFAGWAFADAWRAESWALGRAKLSGAEARDGDHVVFNAWQASTPDAQRFMGNVFRRFFQDKRRIVFKRHYPDGRTRAGRIDLFAGGGSPTPAPDHQSTPGAWQVHTPEGYGPASAGARSH